MKRFYLTVLFLTAAVFTIYSQTGIIKELTGEVELKHAGASDFVRVQAGAQVAQDTIVSTGFRSTALIEVGSTVLIVRPLTRLTLAEIHSSTDYETLNVSLQAGRVRVDVKPPAGTKANATVKTPAATASVRGTSFEMDTKNLTVTSGSVNWQNANGFSTAVTAGFSSAIGSAGEIIDPVEIAVAELTPAVPVGSGTSGETSAPSFEALSSGDIHAGVTW